MARKHKNTPENPPEPPKEFIRSNFLLCCTLQCLDFTMLEMRNHQIDRKKKVFVFEDTPQLQKAVKDYFRGDLLVDPFKFGGVMATMKARIFDN